MDFEIVVSMICDFGTLRDLDGELTNLSHLTKMQDTSSLQIEKLNIFFGTPS